MVNPHNRENCDFLAARCDETCHCGVPVSPKPKPQIDLPLMGLLPWVDLIGMAIPRNAKGVLLGKPAFLKPFLCRVSGEGGHCTAIKALGNPSSKIGGVWACPANRCSRVARLLGL
jgi:hypothetical protein